MNEIPTLALGITAIILLFAMLANLLLQDRNERIQNRRLDWLEKYARASASGKARLLLSQVRKLTSDQEPSDG